MTVQASPTTRARLLTALLAAGFVISVAMGARQGFGLFADAFAARGVPISTYAFAIALQNLVWGIVQPVAGTIADRRGPAGVVAAGAACFAAGLLLSSVADNGVLVVLGMGVLVGIGLAGTTHGVLMSAIGRISSPSQRSFLQGVTGAAGSVGMILLVPLASTTLAGYGLAVALTVLGVIVACALPLGLFLRAPATDTNAPAKAAPNFGAALAEAMQQPGYVLVTLGFFTCGFQLAFLTTHLPAYLALCGMPGGTAGTALALVGLFNIFGMLGCGWLADRVPPQHLLGWMYVLRAAIIAGFFLLPKSNVSVALFAAGMGLLWLGTVPPTNAVITRMFGLDNLGGLFGISFLSHQVGSFLGAWSGGLSIQLTGSYNSVWIACVITGLGAAGLNFAIRLPAAGLRTA